MSEYTIGQDGRLTTAGVQSTNGLSPIAADTRLTVIRSFLSASEISRIFKEVEPTPTPTPASTPDAFKPASVDPFDAWSGSAPIR